MAVRRRRGPARPAKRDAQSRVVKIQNQASWEKLLSKLDQRLLVIHFSATWAQPSKMLRPLFGEISRRSQYSHVVFAEIDVEQMEELAQSLGVQACPTIICWKDGTCVEKSQRGQGGNPATITSMLDRHAGQKPSGPWWRRVLRKAAVVAAAVVVSGFAYQQLVQQRQSQSTDSKAAQLERKLKVVRGSLLDAQRRRQSKLVRDLEEQLEALKRERHEMDELLYEATHESAAVQRSSSSLAADDAVDYSSDEQSLVSSDGMSDDDRF